MKNIAYYNGKTAPIEEMMVPMNDRACYFGDGVYDATCVVNHVPMAFDDHIDRIYRSAKLIDIEIPMEKAEMKALLQGLVDQVEGDVLFLYWQVTRGVGMRNHPYAGAGDKPSLWAFVRRARCAIRSACTSASRWRISGSSIATSRRSTCCPP